MIYTQIIPRCEGSGHLMVIELRDNVFSAQTENFMAQIESKNSLMTLYAGSYNDSLGV